MLRSTTPFKVRISSILDDLDKASKVCLISFLAEQFKRKNLKIFIPAGLRKYNVIPGAGYADLTEKEKAYYRSKEQDFIKGFLYADPEYQRETYSPQESPSRTSSPFQPTSGATTAWCML